jgi:hypothetical protein
MFQSSLECRGIEARPTEKDSRFWQWAILSLRGSWVQIPPPAFISISKENDAF